MAISTQWRAVPVGGGMAPVRVYWMGLDYGGAAAGLAAAGIVLTPALWAGLRIMETAARNALNGIVEQD